MHSSLLRTLSIWMAAKFMAMGGEVIISHYCMDVL